MSKELSERKHDDSRHPWELLEWMFQLLYWVRPGCQNWDETVGALKPSLFATAVGILRGQVVGDVRQSANDVIQEWWTTTIFLLFEKYEPDQPFFPYGHTVFQRLCWARCRSRAAKALPGFTEEPIDPRFNPIRDAKRRDLRNRLGAALWKLPKQQRQPIVLEWKEVPLAKAARRQGCTLNALYVRAVRGRQQLKLWLPDLAKCFRKNP